MSPKLKLQNIRAHAGTTNPIAVSMLHSHRLLCDTPV